MRDRQGLGLFVDVHDAQLELREGLHDPGVQHGSALRAQLIIEETERERDGGSGRGSKEKREKAAADIASAFRVHLAWHPSSRHLPAISKFT